MRQLIPALCSLSVLAARVPAQSIVVPNVYATTVGVGAGNNSFTCPEPRTIMLGIDASELAGIPAGSVINGVSFRATVRQDNAASWPPSDTTYSSFKIMVGYALPLASWTANMLSNFVNTPLPPVIARTGQLIMDPAVYRNLNPQAPQPNPWGEFYWDFQKTLPYVGGHLALRFTHPRSSQPTYFYMDSVMSNRGTYEGYFSPLLASPTGSLSVFTIVRIHYGFGPGCPGSGGMVPNLVQSSDVAGGGGVTFGIANAPAGSVALYVAGPNRTNTALPNGCTLLTSPTIVIPTVLSAKGRSALTTSFPAGLSLTAHVQAFVIDAGAPGGFSATNGVTLTVSP